MNEKQLTIIGTILLIITNIIVIIFGIKAFNSNIPILYIISLLLPIGMLYFDYIVVKYFINKYNERKKKN